MWIVLTLAAPVATGAWLVMRARRRRLPTFSGAQADIVPDESSPLYFTTGLEPRGRAARVSRAAKLAAGVLAVGVALAVIVTVLVKLVPALLPLVFPSS